MTFRTLVTGGAGFIGSHLVEALSLAGNEVTVLDNLSPQVHGDDCAIPGSIAEHAKVVVGDVQDERMVRHVLKDTEVVFHLAAETGVGQSMYEAGSYARTNVAGTATLWDAIHMEASTIKKVILASSCAVYGEGAYHCLNCGRVRPGPRLKERLSEGEWSPRCPVCKAEIVSIPTNEEDAPAPTSVYGITKLTQEQLCMTLARSYEIPVVILRFFNVYGSRQSLRNPYTGILPTFLARMRSKKEIPIYEDGRQMRDLVHVKDVARACLLTATRKEANFQAFNVGSGSPLSIIDLAQALQGIGNYGNHSEVLVTKQYRLGDIRHRYADIGKMRSLLGYEPRVSFDEGLHEFMRWADSQSFVDRTDTAASELASAGLLDRAEPA